MKHPVSVVFFLLLLLPAACVPQAVGTSVQPTVRGGFTGPLVILAASSLSEPFQELNRQFLTDHPGLQMQFSFAGSQQLAQRLAAGAPCDVFASASAQDMDAAIQAGRVDRADAYVFIQNGLVAGYPIAITKDSRNPAAARAFVRLVLSQAGQAVLAKYGFRPGADEAAGGLTPGPRP
jgi:ABC-type molybdate transport system substrate-binding protein